MKKKEVIYFYLANPKTFKYTIWIDLLFKQKESFFINKNDKSVWTECDDYYYYGENTKALVRKYDYSFDFLFDLFLKSNVKHNVFGALNYMIKNYKKDFFKINILLKNNLEQTENIKIYFKYFNRTDF
ncbi:MAG: hypothetical protein FWH05_05755 [Oscillospiraceae bacterium]|nr:hypothetical protein [Oscillospiraceae bacterium]